MIVSQELTRRNFLKGAGVAAVSLGVAGCASTGKSPEMSPDKPEKKRLFRFAHLTDIHVEEHRDADKWMALCLQHAQQQSDPPQAILNGGDVIMDSLAAPADRTKDQWEVMERVFAQECSLPVYHCIGNHDVWGWDREYSKASPDDEKYGKTWAMEVLKLKKRYYSADLNGWHLIVLDSTHSSENRVYEARLDEEQFQWLENELASIPSEKPVIILSHIPIIAACAYFDGDNEKSGDWVVPGRWIHIDARRITELFYKHPNVRLAISGHIHLIDRVDYNDVTYLCNGAVCGNWWKGDYQQSPPGYALIDLYDDGSFDHEFIEYGWTEKA